MKFPLVRFPKVKQKAASPSSPRIRSTSLFFAFTFLFSCLLFSSAVVRAEEPDLVDPDFHSVAAGGSWETYATWEENSGKDCTAVGACTLPGAGDEVEINGTVLINSSKTIAGLLVDETGFLQNQSGRSYIRTLTINGNIINNGTIRGNTRGSLSLEVSGNIENNGTWNPYKTKLLSDVEILNTTTIDGTLACDSHALIVNSPNIATIAGSIDGTSIFNGTGIIKLTGSVRGTISGTIPELRISAADISKYIGATITVGKVVFEKDALIYTASTINGDVEINNDVILQNQSGRSYIRTLTINGNIINNGTIRGNTRGSLSLEVSGNIENNGTWSPYQTKLLSDVEILNTTTIDGTLACDSHALIVNSPNIATIAGSIDGTSIFNGTGIIKLTGSVRGTISGTIPELYISAADISKYIGATITVGKVVFEKDALIYAASTINGDVEINNDVILQNQSGRSYIRTLTINGNIINNGTIRGNTRGSLSLEVSGNIENNGVWNSYKTSLIWEPTANAVSYEFRIAASEQNLAGAVIYSATSNSLYRYYDQSAGAYVYINSHISDTAYDYWQHRAKFSDDSCTDWSEVKTINVPLDTEGRPSISLTPTTHDFGSIEIGSRSGEQVFTITNTGSADLSISGIYLSDPTNYDLNLDSGAAPCALSSPTLTPDASCTLGVVFTPVFTGSFSEALIITSDAQDNPHKEATLSGTSGASGVLAYFTFSDVEDQMVDTPFPVIITAKDGAGDTVSSFTGTVSLWSNITENKLEPSSVNLQNGIWTGDVILYRAGENAYLAGSGDGQAGQSNSFAVAGEGTTNLSGKVVNYNQETLLDVEVHLLKNKDDTVSAAIDSKLTGSEGSYLFENINCGQYYIAAYKYYGGGYAESAIMSVTVECGLPNVVRDIMIAFPHCDHTDDTIPVLLVPGIMGSDSKWNGSVYPTLSKRQDELGIEELKLHDYRNKVGWENLKDELESIDYVKGCTIFDVPYDWRMDVNKSSIEYLKPMIDFAKLKSGKDKVDIVAHSMGGLLARAYIQGDRYENDINKFAMVGTPNQGASLAYYLWEGGDPILADEEKGGQIGWTKYFYTNTLQKLYKNSRNDAPCQFENLGMSDIPKYCDQNKIKQFLRDEEIYSVKQLMPVYDNPLLKVFSYDYLEIEKEENTFLKALNNKPCLNGSCVRENGIGAYSFTPASSTMIIDNSQDDTKVEAKVFAGNGYETIKTIGVIPQDSDYDGLLYRDGWPSPPITTTQKIDGDGTVTNESILLDWLDSEENTSEHFNLVDVFKQSLTNFINK